MRCSVCLLLPLVVLFAPSAVLDWAAARAAQQEASPSIDQLTRDLLEGTRDQRREAAYRLSKLGPKAADAVDALVQALEDRDPQVWFYAVDALANIGPAAAPATDALIRHLARGGRQRWYRSAYALGRIGKAAVPKLLAALEHRDERVRSGAALAFSFNPPCAAEAAGALAGLLADAAEVVRHQAVLALAAAGRPAIAVVKPYLNHEKPAARVAALNVFARLRPQDEDILERITTLASADQSPEVRAAALRCLAEIRPTLTAGRQAAVIAALQAEEQEVRFAAMDVILSYGEDARELIARAGALVATSPPQRRQELAALLERLGPAAAAATEELARSYLTAETPEERRALAEAITAIGHPAVETVTVMIDELGARAATLVSLLARFGPAATAPIIRLAQSSVPEVRAAALTTLATLEGDLRSARDTVLRAAHDARPQVRAAGLMAIAALVDRGLVSRTEAARLAAEALSAEDPRVRLAAIRGAILWAEAPQAAQVARRVLTDNTASETDEEFKLTVLDALVARRLTTPALFDAAATLVASAPRDDIVRAAVQYMVTVRPERPDRRAVRKTVAAAVEHPDPAIRAAAIELVRAYGGTLDEQTARSAVAVLLRDRAASVRVRALEAVQTLSVGGSGDRKLLAAIQEALRDESEAVRQAAVRAVARVLPRSEAVRVLADALPVEASWSVRRAMYQELAEFGPQAAAAMPAILTRLLTTRDDMSDALRAIRRIRTVTPEARPVLLKLLRRRDPVKRVTAAALLTQIEEIPPSPDVISALESALERAPDRLKPAIRATIQRLRRAARQNDTGARAE